MLKTGFPPRAAMTLTTRHKLRLLYLIGLAAVAVAGGYAARHLEPTGPIPPPLPADDEPDTWATKGRRQKLIVDRLRSGEITLAVAVGEVRALNSRDPVRPDYVVMGEVEPQDFPAAVVERRIATTLVELAVDGTPADSRNAVRGRLDVELKQYSGK